MKQKTFFIVFEGLPFGEEQKFDKKNSGHVLYCYGGPHLFSLGTLVS